MKETVSEMERALLDIRSVKGGRIILDHRGEIAEIHILATDERNPKQVVRDVESLLLVKFQTRVDHKKIGVVQETKGTKLREGRLKFLSLQHSTLEKKPLVEITLLSPDGEEFKTQEEIQEGEKFLAVGKAIVCAVNNFLGKEVFSLEDVRSLVSPSGRNVFISSVFWKRPEGREVLLGASLIKGSEEEAAAKATLQAVNRLIPWVLKEKA